MSELNSPNLNELRELWVGKMAVLNQSIKESERLVKTLESQMDELDATEKARALIHEAAELTSKTLAYKITEIGTKGLRDVFEKDLTLNVSFGLRGKKSITSEAEFTLINEQGQEIDPMYGEAGGLLDIVSLVLRVTMLKLTRPQKRSILFLDEPLKALSNNFKPKGAALLKSLSENLGIQIILVNHKDEYNAVADKLIRIDEL